MNQEPATAMSQPHADAPARGRVRRVLPKLLALGVSLFIALAVGEVAVRFLAPQDLSGSWRNPHPRGYLLNKGDGSSRHQFGDRVVHYRFNELHQRGGPVAKDGRRLLAVGDSYTFGWLLNEDDTYIARLQRRADEDFGAGTWQVLNGGGGGWGTADYVAYVEDFGERIRPQLVVVFLNADDIARSTSSPVFRLSGDGQRLETGTPPPPGRLKKFLNGLPLYQYGLEHSHLLQIARKAMLRGELARESDRQTSALTRTPDEARVCNERAVRLVKQLFLCLRDWCDRHGARLVVLTTGFTTPTGPPDDPHRPPTENEAFLSEAAAFFAAEKIPYHNLDAGVVRDAGGDLRPYVIPGDGHPNEAGAALIARYAWDALRPYLAAGPNPAADHRR